MDSLCVSKFTLAQVTPRWGCPGLFLRPGDILGDRGDKDGDKSYPQVTIDCHLE